MNLDRGTSEKNSVERPYESTYRQLFGILPPRSVAIEESSADILSEARGFMSGFEFTMQLQVGCPGGCLFCYVPNGRMLAPSAVKGPQGRNWGFVVRNKYDIAQKLRKHLDNGKLADKTLYWSGVTDPYAASPIMTRSVWQVLCDTPAHLRPRRIAVQTRFRPDRDAEFMVRYCHSASPVDQGPPVVVSFSIGTDRNDLIDAWERATPSYDQRMSTIKALCDAGIFVVATLSPFGIWRDLQGTLKQFRQWGVAYITVLFFKENTKSANTSTLFLAYLRERHPELLDASWQKERVEEMREIYGEKRVIVGQEGFSSLAHPHEIAK